MAEFDDLKAKIRAFNAARDWQQFHNTKNLAISIAIEAAELLEHYQWHRTDEEVKQYEASHREEIADEFADIVTYLLNFADQHGFDIPAVVLRKLEKSAVKYPADKVRGSSKKYTEYEQE